MAAYGWKFFFRILIAVKWTEDEVRILIYMYRDFETLYYRENSNYWKKCLERINQKNPNPKTIAQCMTKNESLKRKYRSVLEKNGRLKPGEVEHSCECFKVSNLIIRYEWKIRINNVFKKYFAGTGWNIWTKGMGEDSEYSWTCREDPCRYSGKIQTM